MLHDGEKEECLLDTELFAGFRTDVMHTFRVEFAPEETRFLVDLMNQGRVNAVDGS